MKDLIFKGESKVANYFFGNMMNWLVSPARYRYNDPLKLLKASGLKPGQRVLEVGCGSGFFTPVLSGIAGSDGEVVSIDLHPSAVDLTIARVNEMGAENVRVLREDAHDTSFPDGYFDMIIVYGVIPAPVISEPRLSIEMNRILKTGGTLAVWTLAPFWSPAAFINTSSFAYLGKQTGVHRMRKEAA